MATIFSDNFESGNFQKWSYIQGADTSQGGPGAAYNYVGTGASFGINAHSGEDVAQFYRPTSATSLPHAKVFKEWSNVGKHDQFGRTEEKLPDGGNPDGVYKAWYYLPADYQVTQSKWTNLFQFKEEGYNNGVWNQYPSWWINMSSAKAWGKGGTEPVLFVNHWENKWDYTPEMVKAPLGRWFEIKAELHENDRIDWFIDGNKLTTSYDSTWDVGRFYDKSNGWIFGVGHYDGYGKVWVDDASFETFGTTPTPTPTPDPTPTPTPTPPPAGAWEVTPTPTTTITGTNGSQTLRGTNANEKFDGLGGEDTFVGGAGGDTYTINSTGDKVVESAGQGVDTVLITANASAWTMPSDVENAVIQRTNGAQVTGNAMDNTITGTNGGADTFIGGMGKDKMTSGGGWDTFIFRKGEVSGDLITDFRGNGANTGDLLRFEGFGAGAKLTDHGNDIWSVDYAGGSEAFTIKMDVIGTAPLHPSDYGFF